MQLLWEEYPEGVLDVRAGPEPEGWEAIKAGHEVLGRGVLERHRDRVQQVSVLVLTWGNNTRKNY